MTIFARPHLSGAAPRAVRHLMCALAVSVAALFAAAPAGALVTEVSGTKVGLQGANQISFVQGLSGELENGSKAMEVFGNPAGSSFGNSSGSPVLHGTSTYAIYWDPKDLYHGDWQHVVDTFLHEVGSQSGSRANVFSVDTQYTDRSNLPASYQYTFRGAYTDTHAYPASGCTSPALGAVSCLTDGQLREELQEFIDAHGLPKGMGAVYYVLTPPPVTVCVDGASTRCSGFERTKKEKEENHYESASYLASICSYHSAINPGGLPTGDENTILYAAIPWSAGFAGRGATANTTGQAAYCQDGGFNAASKPPEEREKVKARTPQEQKEFEEKSKEEQLKLEEQKSLLGPHDEEPNSGECPGPGGFCDTGLADLIVNQISVEQHNILTNPLLNGWQDEAGKEASDECRNYFAAVGMGGGVTANPETGAGSLSNQSIGGHSYYLQMAFNLAALKLSYPGIPCIPGDRLQPQFSSPNLVNSGDVVAFDGMESVVSLNAAFAFSAGGSPQPNYATYTWNFGDGSPTVSGYAPGAPACQAPWLSPCAASAFHSYQYGGTYPVTLTVTDVGGFSASTSNIITVNGPPPPQPAVATPGASGAAAAGTGAVPGASGSTGGGAPGVGAKSTKRPVATAGASSQSLRNVMRSGLLVRYSVDEQVAGRLEVLLPRSLAKRVGIGGPPALGLPAGSAPMVVIGKSVVVTTKAGRSALRLQFSKRTATRLAKLGRVTLTLRLVVRGAHNAAPTTVLSTVTLGR